MLHCHMTESKIRIIQIQIETNKISYSKNQRRFFTTTRN